jgi:dTDP-glucose 4,6-dehydratase
MLRYLVTGGCGFIGSNFIRMLLKKRPSANVTNLDALTYAGNLENLADIQDDPRYTFIHGSISNPADVAKAFEKVIDYVVNFAAETHVDRSLTGATEFIETNVIGTQVLLDAAIKNPVCMFLQASTDEVYGSLGPHGVFHEDESLLAPNSPYSASKAAAEHMVHAAHKTFGLKTVITRSSNNYGPYQFPEKLIPLFLTNAMEDKPLPVYGNGLNRREWLYVEDNCEGILAALDCGLDGGVYNIGSPYELSNMEVTRAVLKETGKPETLIKYVKDRAGHDFRYALSGLKTKNKLNWWPKVSFNEGIKSTAQWYKENRGWWERIKTGEYLKYYEKQYGTK